MDEEISINHGEIQELSRQLFSEKERSQILDIAKRLFQTFKKVEYRHNQEIAMKAVQESILALDKVIGGIGIDRLIIWLEDDHNFTGDYPEEERPIHRPLQYALWSIYLDSSRTAIEEVCQHVEGIMKNKFENTIEGIEFRPLGSITRDVGKRRILNEDIVSQLLLVTEILNIAKHEYDLNAVRIPDMKKGIRSQVFNIHEAISMYFICRKIGMRIIQS